MKPYKRGKVYWARLRWPEHPQADSEGRVRLPLETDKGLAEVALADLIKRRDAERRGFQPSDSSWLTFRNRYEAYLEKMSHSTKMSHKHALREMETFCRGIKDVREFNLGVLDDLHTSLIKRNVGKYMVVKLIKNAKAIMRKAEIWQLSPPQGWKDIKTAKLPRGRIDFYTHRELFDLQRDFVGLWQSAVWLGGKGGLRPAEIFHQNKDTLITRYGKILIKPVPCKLCPKKFHPEGLWTPKGGKERVVEMKPDLLDFLKRRLKNQESEWIISEPYGWRPTYGGFLTSLGDKLVAAKRHGIPYTLRHTYATHEIQYGEDIKKVRDDLGHDSITTTEIYLHQKPACDCATPCAPATRKRVEFAGS